MATSSSSSSTTTSLIFQKTLTDVVKGIRNYKNNPSEFISQAIMECKSELNTTDPYLKSEAIRKLTYLQMLGYNISWASFSIVEVMSQPRFEHKRIGFLAANQSFTESTDVILLTTNLLKKEFTSHNAINLSYDTGLALNCLANIATKDLSRDCISDIVHLLNHQKPYIRKKAIICLYKIYLKYPQGLRLTFDNLREKLDDADTSVVSCAVNVICELARKNPRNYLSMAPKFFQLLTTSSNNWMLIKVVKLMGSLVKEEPRLARKLLEPLATIIQNTSAKSLQYECISTITLALPYTKREDGSDAKNLPNILNLCVTQLQNLLKDPDPNLKYLGLVGFIQLMASHPKIVMEQRDLVLNCLNDEDVTIRSKALELLSGIVTKKSLVDFVHHLLRHLRQAEGSYRDNIISTILEMGGLEKFSLVTDFIWYVSVLQRLACVQGGGASVGGLSDRDKPHHGKRVAEQLMDITLRVKNVRPFAVECMVTMLLDGGKLILGHARDTVAEVMMAAAWICGEFSDVLTSIMLDLKSDEESEDDEDEEDQGYWIEGPEGDEIRSKWRGKPLVVMTIACLLHPRSTNLPARVQSAFIHAAMKIFIRACDGRCSHEHVSQMLALLRTRLPVYLQSVHLEVQERASTLRYLLAETGILAVDAGLVYDGQLSSKIDENGDLLTFKDLEPVDGDDIELTQIRVLSVDISGASAALKAFSYLKSIVSEEFFGVHPKAQRKVQIPDGLDLNTAFNKKAVDDLLSDDRQEEYNISTISFIKASEGPLSSFPQPAKEISTTWTSKEETKSKDFYSENYSQNRYEAPPSYSANEKPPSHGTTDQTFYLHRNRLETDEEESNQEHFADGFQPVDHTETRRKKKSKKSSRKTEKRRDRGPDYTDIAPVVIEEDSGDEKGIFRSNPGDDHEDYEDLENIDLTKPLQPGESLPVLKHRETAPAVSVPPVSSDWDSASQNVDSAKREKKKTRKEKKTKKEKSSKSETKKTESMTEDLLEMSFDAPAPPSSSSLIDNSYPGSTSPTTHSTTKVKKTKILWLPLSSLSGVFDIFYSIEDMLFNGHDIGKISILFRVINRQSTPLSVEISLSSNSTGSYRLGASNKSPLVTSLSSHLEEIQQLVLDVAPTLNPLQTNTIHWQLHSHTSSSMSNPLLLTDDTTSSALSSCHMPWTILSLFQSQSINENEFQALLTSSPSSSTTSSSSISSFINQATHQNKIQIPLPENQTFSRKQITKMLKLLMSYCHSDCMELIEGQSAISCSLLTLPSSRGAGGERYLTCWLMKYLSSGGGGRGNTSIHIEMRYYGPNSSTLQQIGNEILKSLSLISF